MLNWFTQWREKRLLADLDDTTVKRWQLRIDQLPILSGLSPADQRSLIETGWRFLHQKRFTPVADANLTNGDCIDICLQAALPVLTLGIEHYGHFHELLIYPEEFVSPRHYIDDNGIEHQGMEELSGEAWEQGPLLLTLTELSHSGRWDGFNLVIHELAHKLDIANGGIANGHPNLSPSLRQRWLSVFSEAFQAHCTAVEQAEEQGHWQGVWVDPYGAESEAEFFAVCVEAFFTDPIALHHGFNALYHLLAEHFNQHPLPRAPQWSPLPGA
ncbi:zinc-dependent peptidase [Halomonas denitrificans]|nr:zinc-dependent peptidase [Halomonas denitrificans]